MHHIRYRHDPRRGIDGLALAVGAVLAAIRPVVRELDDAQGQRLVEIQAIQPAKRYKITDPRVDLAETLLRLALDPVTTGQSARCTVRPHSR